MIISCADIASAWLTTIKKEIATLGVQSRLGILFIGNDPGSERFVARKIQVGEQLGVSVSVERLPSDVTSTQARQKLDGLVAQSDGVIIQLPLPSGIDSRVLLDAVPPEKDVDGLSGSSLSNLVRARNGFVPATVRGILHLLTHGGVTIKGARVAVLGAGQLVGRPAALALLNMGATVQMLDQHEPNPDELLLQADVIISAVGKPGVLRAEAVNKNALVLDAGFSLVDGRITGDADTKAINQRGARITPVPGGLGALTVAGLYANLLDAIRLEHRG